MQNAEYIRQYFAECMQIVQSFSVSDVEAPIEILFDAYKRGSRVYTCGNGGSASTATHFACDLLKTAAPEGKSGFKAECLNDNIPLCLALINDNGFDRLYAEQLRTKAQAGDVLIALSVHGGAGKDKAGLWSQNLLQGIRYIQSIGGKAIGFSGFDGGPMKQVCDACIVVPANSTPHVECFHVVLQHLIVFRLKEKIAQL